MHLHTDHIWTGISFWSTAIQSGKNYLIRNNQKVEQITHKLQATVLKAKKQHLFRTFQLRMCFLSSDIQKLHFPASSFCKSPSIYVSIAVQQCQCKDV